MSGEPRISVVIPTFDRADELPRAIDSVLTQQGVDLELLVVDDGSTDHTPELLAAVGDPRLRVLRQDNRGVSAARNLGIGAARGEFVTFLDSDDEALPGWLEAFADAFAEPAVGIACCGVRIETLDGGEVTKEEVRLPRALGGLHRHQPIVYTAGSLAAHRDLLIACGGYLEDLAFAENAEFAMRLVPACLDAGLRVEAITRPLVVYRRLAGSRASAPARLRDMRHAAERILELHGRRMRRLEPVSYANHRCIAAVNAARLGDLRAARQHLRVAVAARPLSWKTYLRLAVACLPPLAARVWQGGMGNDDAGERRDR